MDLSEEDVQKILRILDELDYGEIRLEVGQLKLHVQKTRPGEADDVAPQPSQRAATPSASEHARPAPRTSVAREAPVESDTLRMVRAPIAGVFYRAPSPAQAPFVQVGQSVSAEDTVCLLEVMKLFQSVAAGVAGRVAEVLVENGETVNQSQPLIAIEIEA
jgi:acetyl-CoA carboxylase biotin carboxyl carrier protein